MIINYSKIPPEKARDDKKIEFSVVSDDPKNQ